MAIKGEWVKYGDQVGYLALPAMAAPPMPGVVVIQEVGGVNGQIEDVTRRIAAAGYVALAPDLFAVNGTRPPAFTGERIGKTFDFMRRLPPGSMMDPSAREAALAKLPDIERQQITETFGSIFGSAAPDRMQSMVGPLRSAVRYLRTERPETQQQPVGCVGFCMGGGLSALLACEEPELAGAAIFYGSAPPLERVPRIACPVVGFYGALDARINAGLPAFAQAMEAAGKSFEHHVYPGAAHAFFNDDRPSYEVRAARGSYTRLLEFLERTTGP